MSNNEHAKTSQAQRRTDKNKIMQQLLHLDDEEQRRMQLKLKTKTSQQSKHDLNKSMSTSLYNLTADHFDKQGIQCIPKLLLRKESQNTRKHHDGRNDILKHDLYKRKTKKNIQTYQDPNPSSEIFMGNNKANMHDRNQVILNKRINSIQLAPGLRTYTDFKKSPSGIGRQNSNSLTQNQNGSSHATNRKRGTSQFKNSVKETLKAVKSNQRSEVIVLP